MERPLLQVVVRAGLWTALGIGCVGGIVALVRPAGPPAEVVSDPSADASMVPAPVAGVAELTVERWLTATAEERQDLGELFAEPPPAGDTGYGSDETGGLTVSRVTSVGGERLDDGYWSVTVAVELAGSGLPNGARAEGTADRDGADNASDEVDDSNRDSADPDDVIDGTGGEPAGQADQPTTWFLQVGIVGDGDDGFVALTTPAVVPAPSAGDPDWSVSGSPQAPEADDPLADMVEQFLSALLAGAGDHTPYLAPGAEVSAADPPVFTEIAVVELATDDLGDSQVWVSVQVLATTADEVELPLTYDLVLVERTDRWEVVELSGVPTLIE